MFLAYGCGKEVINNGFVTRSVTDDSTEVISKTALVNSLILSTGNG